MTELTYYQRRHIARQRMYASSRWERLRKQVMRERPYCVRCQDKGKQFTLGSICHHKRPIPWDDVVKWISVKPTAQLVREALAKFAPDAWDVDALEMMCLPCHNERHSRTPVKEEDYLKAWAASL